MLVPGSLVDAALNIPPGIAGASLTLWLTGAPLNAMSLAGLIMLAGISMSDSILIAGFAHRLMKEGLNTSEALITSRAIRLRPILAKSA